MPKCLVLITLFVVGWANFLCTHATQTPDNPAAWKKIHLDFQRIDANGLAGRPDGKVAVNYEFCIPAGKQYWKTVHSIDSTTVLQKASKGRVGCTETQWLVIGNTHQPNHLKVLYDLAKQPFISRIEETYWE